MLHAASIEDIPINIGSVFVYQHTAHVMAWAGATGDSHKMPQLAIRKDAKVNASVHVKMLIRIKRPHGKVGKSEGKAIASKIWGTLCAVDYGEENEDQNHPSLIYTAAIKAEVHKLFEEKARGICTAAVSRFKAVVKKKRYTCEITYV